MMLYEFNRILVDLGEPGMVPHLDYYKYIIEPFYNEDTTTTSKHQFAKFYIKHFPSFVAQYQALIVKVLEKGK